MGILQRIWTASQPQERLLTELADIANRHQELAVRLARHADLCVYPNIAGGLSTLAMSEAEHARTLDTLLSERHAGSKLARQTGPDGSSNWQRVSGDLALMLKLAREMNEQALHWEEIEPPFAARLLSIALEDDRNIDELRKLALKCDPQAID